LLIIWVLALLKANEKLMKAQSLILFFLLSCTQLIRANEPTPPKEVISATEEEKQYQINMLAQLHNGNADKVAEELSKLQHAAVQNENVFALLMEASKYCSLGQITDALFEVGGQYRRNI
jgi:methylmalonyl-CoA mutase N-terminal domain/subunit